ncbi:VPLPA-CTERM sorting domain-containing protein [Thioflavicoccus mobilis]|nr:VPLPA-CTERM sorting domain-containing protein [Thioflavicoccus mobilis]
MLLAVGSLALSANAFADDSLQQILNNITVGGDSSVVAPDDALPDGADSVWSITASGGSVSTFIIELAGNANSNTFGVYDVADPNKRVELFDGSATASAQALLSIKVDGSVHVNLSNTGTKFAGNQFGYYLGTTSGIFYSDSSVHGGGDQMLAFQGTGDKVQIGNLAAGEWTANEYVLAWEDLPFASSDKDYNDMVLMVESVQPVPLPAAAWLFGSALFGMAGVGWRRRAHGVGSALLPRG